MESDKQESVAAQPPHPQVQKRQSTLIATVIFITKYSSLFAPQARVRHSNVHSQVSNSALFLKMPAVANDSDGNSLHPSYVPFLPTSLALSPSMSPLFSDIYIMSPLAKIHRYYDSFPCWFDFCPLITY